MIVGVSVIEILEFNRKMKKNMSKILWSMRSVYSWRAAAAHSEASSTPLHGSGPRHLQDPYQL